MIPPLQHDHGIITLDADYLRPGLAAIHLIVEQGHVAIIDTGTNQAVPSVLAALEARGLTPGDVDYVIVTHVHLDHAGAAGALMRACPNARLVAHPSGARHLIDPAKLVAGSIQVYGRETFQRLYGDIVPVPAERVMEAPDNHRLDFQGRVLTFLDTPGHARHHFCIHDERSESVFTGDTFGISYREFDVDGRPFIFPTTTPVQFDPMALHASIDRILALEPEAAFLTHYGRVTHLASLAPPLHEIIDEWCELALSVAGEGDARQTALEGALEKSLLARLRAHGCTLEEAVCRGLLANDVHLNAQGLLVWRDRT
jgi:glyoxylase-like metal-dependent hydrolase (beta-lactamase superfamily II)